MPDRRDDTSALVFAPLAGVGYLPIIATGIFAEFFVRSVVIGPAFAAELSFALWLLLKGVRLEGLSSPRPVRPA